MRCKWTRMRSRSLNNASANWAISDVVMKSAADRSVEGIVFEFIPGPRVSREVLDEVTKFLDTQVISHPFQYPGWSPIRSWVPSAKTFCCVLRSEQTIRFFGRGGIL